MIMADIEYKNNEIEVNGNKVETRREIRDVVVCDNVVVVLLDVPPNEEDPQNIIGLDVDGNRLWDIEEVPSQTPQTESVYMTLQKENDTVLTSNWNGNQYEIDLHDGSVTTVSYSKGSPGS